jgi:hypothetical protein
VVAGRPQVGGLAAVHGDPALDLRSPAAVGSGWPL